MTSKEEREAKFIDLVGRVQACRQCHRMKDSARVLGPGCGPLDAPLMFIGEAPGRLGADDSELPFHGDKSGHNFERLIEQVGLSRYQVFVTNAVLCNPRDENGNNATPTATEIGNCAAFLREQVLLLEPRIVVTLGAVALRACSMVHAHALALRTDVRTSTSWFGRRLIPAYHPGQRAMVHRSFANQLADYQFVAESVRRFGRKRRRVGGTGPEGDETRKLGDVAQYLLAERPGGMSYFALHKLCFLAEVAQLEAVGERIANSYVVRQKDGPYYVDLHLAKLRDRIPGLVVDKSGSDIWLRLAPQLELEREERVSSLSANEEAVLDMILRRHSGKSATELKRVVYLSKPMRALLRKERSLRVNLFNTAVLPYKEKASN